MPSLLALIARVMERNCSAQNYKNVYEVYRATGSEEIQLKFVQIASDDQC
jgi:hypothetical protein